MPQKMTLHFWKIVFEFHNLQRNGGWGGNNLRQGPNRNSLLEVFSKKNLSYKRFHKIHHGVSHKDTDVDGVSIAVSI